MLFASYMEQTDIAPEGNPPVNDANHIPPTFAGSESSLVIGKKNADIIHQHSS